MNKDMVVQPATITNSAWRSHRNSIRQPIVESRQLERMRYNTSVSLYVSSSIVPSGITAIVQEGIAATRSTLHPTSRSCQLPRRLLQQTHGALSTPCQDCSPTADEAQIKLLPSTLGRTHDVALSAFKPCKFSPLAQIHINYRVFIACHAWLLVSHPRRYPATVPCRQVSALRMRAGRPRNCHGNDLALQPGGWLQK